MNIEDKVRLFHKDGFVIIPDAIDAETIGRLREDIDKLEKDTKRTFRGKRVWVYHRMFEVSRPHFELFFQEPITTLAEAIINDGVIQSVGGDAYNADFTQNNSTLETHVIHNNALVVMGGRAGIDTWHQDDPPHYIVTDGPAPKNIHLPVLALTANYYLTDVTSLDNGPTVFIPGSHLFGKPCAVKIDEDRHNLFHALGKAGTAIVFNCQIWHRGSANTSDKTRYVSQVTYGRRFIGHKHYPFMSYQFPPDLVESVEKDERKRRLIGFLSHGPYA